MSAYFYSLSCILAMNSALGSTEMAKLVRAIADEDNQ